MSTQAALPLYLTQGMHRTAALFHLMVTVATTLGLTAISAPFTTAIILCVVLFLQDRTVYFIYSSMLLMTLGLLSPLILAGAPIALKIPPNGSEYDRDMILSLYWFIWIFSYYINTANKIQNNHLSEVRIGKSDLIPCLSAVVLLVFSALMLQSGTLLSSGYRDVTAERHGFIEFASLVTLIGFCAARSKIARNILLGCAFVYLATTFLVGLRLRFISVGTVVFCCLVGIKIKQGWKIGGLLGGVALFALGAVRNSGFTGANLWQALSLENQFNRGALVSTPGGAFQTSKFHAYHVEYIALQDHINGASFLIGDILSIFITRGGLPNAIEIKSQTSSYLNIPGGGLLPGYFYAYTGVLGVIILSIIFMMIFIRILKRRGPQSFPYQVILAAYAPRLLLYDWTIAFKMMFYFFILKSILLFISRSSQVNSKFRNQEMRKAF
jgi:hypothetical protein